MSSTPLYVGDQIRWTVTFATEAGTATDPTTVTFKATNNATGTTTSYVYGVASEVTKTGTGVFKFLLTLGAAGLWTFSAQGTGTVAKSEDITVTVRQRTGD
jgi:hypothetical protein